MASKTFIDGFTVIDADWCGDVDDATYHRLIVGSNTYDPPSLVDGAGASTTVTVSGAILGDFAIASFSSSTQGITVSANVTSTDTVTVRFQNETGGTIDLASGTLSALVIKKTFPFTS